MDMRETAGKISAARKVAGLTQAQVAERFGITDRAVAKWEAGKCLPSAEIMLELCELLQIEVEELLGGKGSGESPLRLWGEEFPDWEREPCIAVMDAFDGLHIGQRKLLDSAYVQARSEGLRLAIITFEAMPASRPDAEQPVRDWQRLTTDRARWCGVIRYAEQFGRRCQKLIIPDCEESRMQSAGELVDSILQLFDIRELHVSQELRCGARADCGAAELQVLCHQRDVPCSVHPALVDDGMPVSTCRVSELIADGDVDAAVRLLAGRLHRYCGTLETAVHKDGVSEFALVTGERRRVVPAAGVYSGYVVIRNPAESAWKGLHLAPAVFSVAEGGNNPSRQPQTFARVLGEGGVRAGETLDMLFAHRLRRASAGTGDEIADADVEWVREVLPPVDLGDLWDLVLFGSEDDRVENR